MRDSYEQISKQFYFDNPSNGCRCLQLSFLDLLESNNTNPNAWEGGCVCPRSWAIQPVLASIPCIKVMKLPYRNIVQTPRAALLHYSKRALKLQQLTCSQFSCLLATTTTYYNSCTHTLIVMSDITNSRQGTTSSGLLRAMGSSSAEDTRLDFDARKDTRLKNLYREDKQLRLAQDAEEGRLHRRPPSIRPVPRHQTSTADGSNWLKDRFLRRGKENIGVLDSIKAIIMSSCECSSTSRTMVID